MKNLMIEAFELKRKGYYKQAIEIYYKIMSAENDNIEILSELADLYFLLGNNERAIHYANKALEVDTEHVSSLSVLRRIYLKEQSYNDAENIAKKIYNITKSDLDLSELIDIFEYQQKYDEIVSYCMNVRDEICLYKS
ncbi:MAG: tetratricopeptide repeat protein, partial [Candidatus Gastranaerophilales bacterium]|nr:tetratricopeptide repeat protein [Candidatus Gastranaerophilales bacterium]